MHNRVHIYLGGLMSQVPVASNDPLFWVHHVFVDMIFEQWLRTHTDQVQYGYIPVSGAKNGHNRDDCLMPFFPFVTNAEMFATSDNFGYTYDIFSDGCIWGLNSKLFLLTLALLYYFGDCYA